MRDTLLVLASALTLTLALGTAPTYAGGNSVDGHCAAILAEHDTSNGSYWYCHRKWDHPPYAHVLNYGYPPPLPGYAYAPTQPGYVYAPPQPGYAYPPPQPGYAYPPPVPNYGYPPPVQTYGYAPY